MDVSQFLLVFQLLPAQLDPQVCPDHMDLLDIQVAKDLQDHLVAPDPSDLPDLAAHLSALISVSASALATVATTVTTRRRAPSTRKRTKSQKITT